MRRRSNSFLLALLVSLAACSPHRFFYLPNKVLYADPAKMGMPYEMVTFPSLNKKKVFGIIFRTDADPKGTVVHLHGNFGNVSNHFLQSQWLTKYGFDVLLLDYQGYGGSEGRPTPSNTVKDGIAAVRYAREHLRNPETGVVLFGQSLGAAVATVVAAREPSVKGVVIESGFSTYPGVARAVLKRSLWTWPLYPVYPLLLGSTYSPLRHVDRISPRPVLFVAGDQDRIVPFEMSIKLYKKAKEPKRLWVVKGAGHLGLRKAAGPEYETMLTTFFSDALKNNN